jgi:hypothetical protein
MSGKSRTLDPQASRGFVVTTEGKSGFLVAARGDALLGMTIRWWRRVQDENVYDLLRGAESTENPLHKSMINQI